MALRAQRFFISYLSPKSLCAMLSRYINLKPCQQGFDSTEFAATAAAAGAVADVGGILGEILTDLTVLTAF